MAEEYINGIQKGGMQILAMNFPYRKKIGLGVYDRSENAYIKVATFNNEQAAEYFIEYLAEFVNMRGNTE